MLSALGRTEYLSAGIAALNFTCLKVSIYNHECVDSSSSNSLIWRRGKMVHFTSGFQEEVNSWSAKSDWWTVQSLFVGELVWPVTLAVWVEDFAEKQRRNTHTHTHTHVNQSITFGSHCWDFVATSDSIMWLFRAWSYSVQLNCWPFHFSLNTHLTFVLLPVIPDPSEEVKIINRWKLFCFIKFICCGES